MIGQEHITHDSKYKTRFILIKLYKNLISCARSDAFWRFLVNLLTTFYRVWKKSWSVPTAKLCSIIKKFGLFYLLQTESRNWPKGVKNLQILTFNPKNQLKTQNFFLSCCQHSGYTLYSIRTHWLVYILLCNSFLTCTAFLHT